MYLKIEEGARQTATANIVSLTSIVVFGDQILTMTSSLAQINKSDYSLATVSAVWHGYILHIVDSMINELTKIVPNQNN